MINEKEMAELKRIAELLDTMNPEGNEGLVYMAFGNHVRDAVSILKGDSETVAALIATICQLFLEGKDDVEQKRLKAYFIARIMAF